MFRWTNKQPGIQKFWNLCGHYQDIYDWISPLNKSSGLPFILTQQSVGRSEQNKSGHSSIFTALKHLVVLLRCNFSGLRFYTLSKTLIACKDMQLRFLKWKHYQTMPLKYVILRRCLKPQISFTKAIKSRGLTWINWSIIAFRLRNSTCDESKNMYNSSASKPSNFFPFSLMRDCHVCRMELATRGPRFH